MKVASFFTLSALLAVGACADANRQTQDLPNAPSVSAAPPTQGPCSFNDARAYARDYFKLSGDRSTARNLLDAAASAPAGSRTRNDRFFALFQLIQSARAAGQTNAPATGASLVLEADDCGEFIISHRDAHLATVLTGALTQGAFAYRDGAQPFVATADGGAALYTADWNAWIGGRSMVFGTLFSATPTEVPVNAGFSYRFGLIYDDATTDALGQPVAATPGPSGQDDIASVELCDGSVTYLAIHRVGRIKATGAQTVLQQANIGGFCDGLGSSPRPSGFLARALHGVIGFFVPTPLQARRRAPPGMAGGIGELSDFIGVNAQFVVLSLPTQPQNGNVGAPITFSVRAVGANGTPLENVTFTVTVDGNEGTNVVLSGGCTETDESGTAACSVTLNKTGGYRLRVTADFTGFAQTFIITNLFNIQQ